MRTSALFTGLYELCTAQAYAAAHMNGTLVLGLAVCDLPEGTLVFPNEPIVHLIVPIIDDRAPRGLRQNKATSACREVRTPVEKAQADLSNRAHGLLAEAKAAKRHEPVDEDQLIARVCTKLGRLVSNPQAIEVIARDAITLRGAVLEREAQHVVSEVGSIRGVSSVCGHLVRHSDAANIATLQGGRERHPTGPFFRHQWLPALATSGVAGAGIRLYGLFSSSRAVKAVALPFGMNCWREESLLET